MEYFIVFSGGPRGPPVSKLARNWKIFKPSYLLHFSTIFHKIYMEMKLMKSRIALYLFGVQKVEGGGLKMARNVRVKLELLETELFHVKACSNLS